MFGAFLCPNCTMLTTMLQYSLQFTLQSEQYYVHLKCIKGKENSHIF